MLADTNAEDLIFTPEQASNAGTAYLKGKRDKTALAIPLGLPTLDKTMLPLLPGELISIIARPGGGKTGFMMRWARWWANQISERANAENHIVVYATWEQSVEELHSFMVAADEQLSVTNMARGEISDDEWSRILRSGVDRILQPLWFIGHSLERRKKRPAMNVTTLAEALRKIEDDYGKIIDMVFIDYLQRIPAEGRVESKAIATSDILDRLKDGALAFGCPFVVGVQARREVDARDEPVPGLDDGQWTSNCEQSSDKVFSLVRPRKYRNEGERFLGRDVVGSNQMVISILKQKMGMDNVHYWVKFDPIYNRLDELEIRQTANNGRWNTEKR